MWRWWCQPSCWRDRAHVDAVRGLVERAADAVVALERAHVEVGGLRADVLEVLAPADELEELDGVRGPAGDVARQLLEHRQRALAAPVGDRLGDVGAAADGVAQRVVADEVADVGDDPRAAGLDEEVVVELRDVVLDDVDLLGDDPQQRAQDVALVGVLVAVDGRQQLEEAVGVAHFLPPPKILMMSKLTPPPTAPPFVWGTIETPRRSGHRDLLAVDEVEDRPCALRGRWRGRRWRPPPIAPATVPSTTLSPVESLPRSFLPCASASSISFLTSGSAATALSDVAGRGPVARLGRAGRRLRAHWLGAGVGVRRGRRGDVRSAARVHGRPGRTPAACGERGSAAWPGSPSVSRRSGSAPIGAPGEADLDAAVARLARLGLDHRRALARAA